MPLSDAERNLMARTMLAEAGDQGDQGLAAVAAVIKNRAMGGDPDFPRDITGVIHQRNAFTAWSNPRGKNNPMDYRNSDPQLLHAGEIADQVMSGERPDLTGGATYYANVPLAEQLYGHKPSFSNMPVTAQIGSHTFYNPNPSPSVNALLGPSPLEKTNVGALIGASPLDFRSNVGAIVGPSPGD